MINLNRLKNLLGNDEAMVNRFIRLYCTQMPKALQSMKEGIEGQEWEKISIAAHDIKNQSRYLDLQTIANLAEEIEYAANKKAPTPQLNALHEYLKKELQSSLKKLEIQSNNQSK